MASLSLRVNARFLVTRLCASTVLLISLQIGCGVDLSDDSAIKQKPQSSTNADIGNSPDREGGNAVSTDEVAQSLQGTEDSQPQTSLTVKRRRHGRGLSPNAEDLQREASTAKTRIPSKVETKTGQPSPSTLKLTVIQKNVLALASSDLSERDQASKALKELGADPLPAALEMMAPKIIQWPWSDQPSVVAGNEVALRVVDRLIPTGPDKARQTAEYGRLVKLLADENHNVRCGAAATLARFALNSAGGLQSVDAIRALRALVERNDSAESRKLAEVALTADLVCANARIMDAQRFLPLDAHIGRRDSANRIDTDLRRFDAAGVTALPALPALQALLEGELEMIARMDKIWIQTGDDAALMAKQSARYVYEEANLRALVLQAIFTQSKKSEQPAD